MTGAGMLYINKKIPEIATVFTTHATMLGRSLAGNGVDIYTDIEAISPAEMAAKMNVTAKHSLETATAREADCFTTVSDITAGEATHFLRRRPQVVLHNGINIGNIPDCVEHKESVLRARGIVIDFAAQFLQETIDIDTAKILLISGRYEFRNKGIDIFLESLKGGEGRSEGARDEQKDRGNCKRHRGAFGDFRRNPSPLKGGRGAENRHFKGLHASVGRSPA